MPRYARISVNIPQLTGLFDYQIPIEFEHAIKVGSLVSVPFGRQTAQGIVIDLLTEPSVAEVKPIQAVIESEPALTAYQMRLAAWIAEENLSTFSQCLDMMLPQGLSQHADVLIQRQPGDLPPDLTTIQTRILSLLQKRGSLRGRQIDAALPRVSWRESLPGLVKRGLIFSQPILPPPSVRPRFVRTAQFLDRPQEEAALGRTGSAAAQRRKAVLDFLEAQAIPINVPWVYAETGATSADLHFLAETGSIVLGETEIWRDPLEHLKPVLAHPPDLTTDQADAWELIADQLEKPEKNKPNLLMGVTGSGKTELYLKATAEILKRGQGVVILVPEISLTPQTVKRFFGRFPGKVGLIHSKLSTGERYDTWRRIRDGKLPIVLGPRSALFAPLPHPGLIIIDECHDTSYHQDDFQPHYHAVTSALACHNLFGTQVILGSATPDLETIHLFEQKDWNLIRLPNRIMAHGTTESTSYSPMPAIQLVDMRQELVAGNRSAISRELRDALAGTLDRGEQTILFLNRRGTSSYVFCRECGFVLRCPRCDTQLTYHADETALICHTCNYHRNMPQKCPSCGSANIRQFGMGTQSLEKLVLERFPGSRVLRWDADTTRFKGAHDLILDHFTQHRADILIGTQMLAKGLDLPLVTLVGVILADTSLNLPDFRAAERTFQLLTQVAGRAGRSDRGGKVIFQTFQPEHYAIASAAAYDSEGFYRKELAYRESTDYPPFSRLLKIEFRHSDPVNTEKAAIAAGNQIKHWIESSEMKNTSLIGPVPCFYQKRSGLYRWQILIRGPDPRLVLRDHPLKEWLSPGMNVDFTVDPSDLL